MNTAHQAATRQMTNAAQASKQAAVAEQTRIARQHLTSMMASLDAREAAGKIDSEHLKDINQQLAHLAETLSFPTA